MTHARVPVAVGVLLGFALASLAGTGRATIYEVTPETIDSVIGTLVPGDELVLAGGTYNGILASVSGSAGNPIIIRAKAGEEPVITGGGGLAGQISGSHLTFRGLTFSGGLGVRIQGASTSFVTIEDCRLHSSSGPFALQLGNAAAVQQGHRIARNEIYASSGDGISVGCASGDCRVLSSTIEGNYVHDTALVAIRIQEGSHDLAIRDNVVHDALGCITSDGTLGLGGANVVERNAVWSCANSGIRAARDARIRNNVVLSDGSPSIYLAAGFAGTPDNVQVAHNTVIQSTGDGVTVFQGSSTVIVANNAVYSAGSALVIGDIGVVVSGNVGSGTTFGVTSGFSATGNIATDFVDASFVTAPPIDLMPAPGSALIGAGDPVWALAEDFSAWERAGTLDVGAYRFDPEGNRGWPIQAGNKPVTSCPTHPDPFDADGDGITNGCETDDDADGIADLFEVAAGTSPLNADTDGDGTSDRGDNCPVHANATQADADGDGIGDPCDAWKPLDLSDTSTRTAFVSRELSLDPIEVGVAFAVPGRAAEHSSTGAVRRVFVSGSSFEEALTATGAQVEPGSSTGWTIDVDATTHAVTSTWNYVPLGGGAPIVSSSSTAFGGGTYVNPSLPDLTFYCPTPPCTALVATSPFDPATGRANAIGGVDVPPLNALPPPNDLFDPSADLRLCEYDYASDPDGDALDTGGELAAGTDPLVADTDADGLSDGVEVAGPTDPLDADTDDDGLLDSGDFCPTQPGSDPQDLDGDRFGNSCDNCPRTHNPDQQDRGGVASAVGDGVGDACQSADFDGNGVVDLLDVTLLRRAIAAEPPGVDPSMPP